jgi:ribonuclease T2
VTRIAVGSLAFAIKLLVTSQLLAGGEPGKFDYYVLALSWSPSYCADEGRTDRSPQCSGTRPYALVLHGLWPQHESGWPSTCNTGRKPWVPSQVVSSMLDIMPARRLVIHQYRKHGTCSGLEPEAYFRKARKAFESVKIPPRFLGPEKPVVLSPREIEDDFLKSNKDLNVDMISIVCGRGNRLREIRICFSKDLTLRPCGPNETQSRLCRLDRLVMPPARGRRQ